MYPHREIENHHDPSANLGVGDLAGQESGPHRDRAPITLLHNRDLDSPDDLNRVVAE
jgi:hypothetical protein